MFSSPTIHPQGYVNVILKFQWAVEERREYNTAVQINLITSIVQRQRPSTSLCVTFSLIRERF